MGGSMKKSFTEESLSIIWDNEEMPGLTIYGFWLTDIVSNPDFPLKFWDNQFGVKVQRLYDCENNDWTVFVWDMIITHWPSASEWINKLNNTLKYLVEHGALVAWCGLEGYFADPPYLFDPVYMSGGIYAIYTQQFGFVCTAYMGKSFRVIADNELNNIRELILGNMN